MRNPSYVTVIKIMVHKYFKCKQKNLLITYNHHDLYQSKDTPLSMNLYKVKYLCTGINTAQMYLFAFTKSLFF